MIPKESGRSGLGRAGTVLFFAVLPLIPLWRCVLLGEAIGPFDQIRQFAPWFGHQPSQPWDVLQADGVLQFYPWRDMVFKAWGNGQLPLWNHYELAGTPLLANSQSAGFYPPHVAIGLLHVPTGLAMVLLAWFHLFWAGLGTYLLTRSFRAAKLGALVAGSSFQLSAFMLAWTGLPSVISTVAWIPWLLFGIKRLFDLHPFDRTHLEEFLAANREEAPRDPDSPGFQYPVNLQPENSNRRGRDLTRATFLTAFATGMMLLAGHLQFAAYGLMAAVFLAICLTVASLADSRFFRSQTRSRPFRELPDAATEPVRVPLFRRQWLGSGARVLASLALGFALAAPQLLPVLNYSRFSHRRNPPSAEGYASYVRGAIQPYELATLSDAYTLGSPRSSVLIDERPISAYWPALDKPGANLAESAVTVGPFIIGLLVLFDWRRRSAWPLGLIGASSLLLALGTALNWPLYFLVPGWSSTGSPGRVIVLFVLTAMVIGGLGCDPEAQFAKPRRALALFLPVIVAAIAFGLSQVGPSEKAAPFAGLASTAALPPTVIGAFIALAALSVLVFPAATKYRPALAAVPLLLAWLGYANNLIPTGNPIPVQPARGLERVAVENDSWSLYYPVPSIAPPNTAYLLGLHELGGYDSLLDRDTKKLIDTIDGRDSSPSANGNMVFVQTGADPAKLVQAGVSEILTRSPLPILGDQAPDDRGVFRYPLNGLAAEPDSDGGRAIGRVVSGRAVTPQGRATILSESFTGLRLRASGPGRLVLRDRNMPGWMAKVDGKHVPIRGTTWREVDLPPGEHDVEFIYVPPGMMSGLMLGLPAWLVLMVLGVACLRKVSRA